VILRLSLSLLCLSTSLNATSSFYERKAEGWHWYQQMIQNEEEVTEEEDYPQQTPTDIITQQKQALELSLHKAVVSGKPEDVLAYLEKQKALMDQSARFAQAWQVAILTHPQFDERTKNSPDQFARHIHYKLQQEQRRDRIKALSKTYGLFFLFRGNCPYCHTFAPVVAGFSRVYGWDVLPISLDGSSLPEFPHPQPDNGISERLGIQTVPALIAVHPQTGEFIPLAYGLASLEEIERRVEALLVFNERKGS